MIFGGFTRSCASETRPLEDLPEIRQPSDSVQLTEASSTRHGAITHMGDAG